MEVSCIILAGGKSTRLGRNKITEVIGQQSLLERVISRLSTLQSEIIIVTARDSSLPELRGYPGLRKVTDIYPGKGSLGGIYTGLAASKTVYNLVVACDMPFLSLKLLQYMIGQAENYDVVIPRVNKETLEPLHAVYSKNCMAAMEYLIKQNRLSILELYPMVKVKYLDDAVLERFDPEQRSFFNVNTEADLQAGKIIAGKEDINRDQC